MKRKLLRTLILSAGLLGLLGLFALSGCEEEAHSHIFEEEVIRVADCTNKGEIRLTCPECGYSEIKTEAALGHDFGEWEGKPHCVEAGEEKRTCALCGETQTRSVPPTGHEWGQPIVTKQPTCTEEGTEERTCALCNITQSRSLPCIDHDWGQWTVTEQPTCLEAGERQRSCLTCEGTQKDPIEALGHDFGEWKIVIPSDCAHEGEKRRTCSRCEEYLSEQIPLLEHTYREDFGTRLREATCLYTGVFQRECTVCGEKGETVYEPALSHVYADGVCKNCGRRDWTKAETHDPDLYDSDFAFKSFLETEDGPKMQELYLEIDERARKYHNGESNASDLGEFEWNGLTQDEAVAVWKGYLDDHPLYYWFARAMVLPYEDKYVIPVDENYTDPETRRSLNETIYTQADEWRKAAPDNAYLATLAYHDFILERVDYLDERVAPLKSVWAHNIVGVFKGDSAVCEGFARSFQLMLNMTGIENIFVTGTTKDANHAYNLVRLDDGEWYWYDLTYDDDPGFMWGIDYNYFAVSEHQNTQWSDAGWGSSAHREFLENHTPDNGVGVHFLGALPARAEEPYEGFGEPLLRQTFTEGKFRFAVTGFNTVQLVHAEVDGSGVKVPETVMHDGVTYTVISVGSIENGEFGESSEAVFGEYFGESEVGSVYLPSTIKFLWGTTFKGKITSYEVAEDNPYFTVQDGVLFTKHMYTLIAMPSVWERTEYTIPDGVHVLAEGMMHNSDSLKKLTIGKDVERWGMWNWGTGLPDSDDHKMYPITIGFWGGLWLFPNLEKVEVHPENQNLKIENDSLMSFDGEYYYASLPDAVEAVIPSSVKYVECNAFYCRYQLEKITFEGATIERIDNAFGNNYTFSKTGEIVYPGTRAEWDRIEIDDNDYEDLKEVKITCLKEE